MSAMITSRETYPFFRRCLPFIVREENAARILLEHPENHLITRRDPSGMLIGLSVLRGDTIYLLCVDESCRRQGIGSALLAESEAFIQKQGYKRIHIGAGDGYLAPGVPTSVMPHPEFLQPAHLWTGLTDEAAVFFQNRGYVHRWSDCNCFDMHLNLSEAVCPPFCIGDTINGVCYRWALPSDQSAVCACTEDAHPSFTRYYANPSIYKPDSASRVLTAECGGQVCGVLIVSAETEGKGIGSAGCTAVRKDFRSRRIASTLVILGTHALKAAGLDRAFVGYTYSGLNTLYARAGYSICAYYFMAEKTFVL